MKRIDLGPVTAYAMAVEKGYEGTEEEFAILMAESGNNALRAEAAADRAEDVLQSVPLDFKEVSQSVNAMQTDAKLQNDNVDSRALEQGFLNNINRPSEWVQGGSQGDGGIVGEDSPYYRNRISSKGFYYRGDFDAIHANAPYQINVFQFADDGAYLGETGNYYNIHISELPDMAFCRIQVRNSEDPDGAIDPSAGENILIMKEADTNSEYERGDINVDQGYDVPASGPNWWNRFRTRGFANDVSSMQIDAGYRLGLYAYDKHSRKLIDYRTINGPAEFCLSDAYAYRFVFFKNGYETIMFDDVRHYGLNAYRGTDSWTSLKTDWQNGYIGGNGEVLVTTDLYRNKNIVTTSFIPRTVNIVRCVSPYVAQYHQYDADGKYIGASDVSRLLVIPDQDCRYRIQVRNAYGTDGPDIDPSIAENVDFVEGAFSTRYGNAAYFAPFDGVNSYYRGHQGNYGRFNRYTTTAELYAAFDELIAASGGYIRKTVLGKCSDGVQDLIRLDCVETGVYADRTDRANKPKVIIVAGQHGGEKCSCYSLYYWLKDMIEHWQQDGRLEYVRYHCHLIIIPVANPYGFDKVQYHNANDVNLNRNYVANWDGSGNGGSGPLSEPETQTIAALVKKERSAIYLADYHCNGDSTTLPDGAKPNWHSQLQTYDAVHDSIGTASKTHIDNISRHWWIEYSDFLKKEVDGSCGSVDTGYWETGLPTLQGYASRNGIIANTFEGLNGFTDREGFGAEGAEACTKLIGNWIMAVLMHYARYFDISNFE